MNCFQLLIISVIYLFSIGSGNVLEPCLENLQHLTVGKASSLPLWSLSGIQKLGKSSLSSWAAGDKLGLRTLSDCGTSSKISLPLSHLTSISTAHKSGLSLSPLAGCENSASLTSIPLSRLSLSGPLASSRAQTTVSVSQLPAYSSDACKGELVVHRPAPIVVRRPPTKVLVNHAPIVVQPAPLILNKPPPKVIRPKIVKQLPRRVRVEPVVVRVNGPAERRVFVEPEPSQCLGDSSLLSSSLALNGHNLLGSSLSSGHIGEHSISLGHAGDHSISLGHAGDHSISLGHAGDHSISLGHGGDHSISLGHAGDHLLSSSALSSHTAC